MNYKEIAKEILLKLIDKGILGNDQKTRSEQIQAVCDAYATVYQTVKKAADH